MKKQTGLKYEKNFVPIQEGDRLYYGGDQAWFSTALRRHSACGTVAAANILAYDKLYKPGANLPAGKDSCMPKASFLELMNQVYRYVSPLRVPLLPEDTPPYRGFGWSAGVWPAGRLMRGFKRLGRSRGLRWRAVPYQRGRGTAADFIRQAVEQDCPVALLIGTGTALKNIPVVYPWGASFVQTDFSKHWVVVTALEQREDGIYIKVSTWGGFAWLPLSACFQTGIIKSRMCYFVT